MKKFKLILPLLLLACGLQAQIGLKVSTKYYNNLIYDEMPVTVQLENYTGNMLLFPEKGTNPGLSFDVYDSRGNKLVPSKTFFDVIAGRSFPSARTFKCGIDLAKLYNLHKGDVYRCRAVLSHPMLEHQYMSKEIMFQVLNPPVIKRITVGLPLREGDKKIKRRSYNILIFETDGGAMYYLRVEDDKMVYKTVPLALKRTNYPPQIQVDTNSFVHVLLYTHPKLFDYMVVDYHGRVLKSEKYRSTESRPALYKDPDIGRVMVVGGGKAVEGIDYVKDGSKKTKVAKAQKAPVKEPVKDAKSVFDKGKSADAEPAPKSVFEQGQKQPENKGVEKKKSVFE